MNQVANAPGMTVWEWLAILAVAAGFGFVLHAGYQRAPQVDDARVLKNELEEIDRVIRKAEADGAKPADGTWDPPEFLPMVRDQFTRLRETGNDPFGNPYPPVEMGARPAVADATVSELGDAIHPSFWSPFPPASSASKSTTPPTP